MIWRPFQHADSALKLRDLPFDGMPFTNRAEFERYEAALKPVLDRRYGEESRYVQQDETFEISGICAICCEKQPLTVTGSGGETLEDGRTVPNWRETLVCRCGANCRERALFHASRSMALLRRGAHGIALSESTPLLRAVERCAPSVVGTRSRSKLRSAGAESLDVMIVTEPVDGLTMGEMLTQAGRSLRPFGRLIFTWPFHYREDQSSQSGDVIGWDILKSAEQDGFRRGEAVLYWSKAFGYLGACNFLFAFEKA